MDIFSPFIQLGLSFLLGSVIGLEREVNEKKVNTKHDKTALIGLRSFALISLLGTITGFLITKFLAMAIILASAFFVLLITLYILDSLRTKDPGITTELAMIYSFIIGFLIPTTIIPTQLVIALTVMVMLFLSRKQQIKKLVKTVDNYEMNALVSYLIIALVILPFLPNTAYAIKDFPPLAHFMESFAFYNDKISSLALFNPYKLWFTVALVTGVDLIGYILEQMFGQRKGWLVTSAVGGFVSSTATTQSLAKESKSQKVINHLVGAAILANIISFLQILLLVSPVNSQYALKLLPVVFFMIITGAATLFFFFRTKEKQKVKEVKKDGKTPNIIDISFALKFALLYISIGILAKIALVLFGNNGLFVVIGLGALVGLDAAILNTAQLAGSQISWDIALYAFIMANAINLLAKTFYSRVFGTPGFAMKFFIAACIIICGSFLGVGVQYLF